MTRTAFFEALKLQLELNVMMKPKCYAFKVSEIPSIVSKMRANILQGNYDKNDPGIKETTQLLGIRHTYKAINAYLNN